MASQINDAMFDRLRGLGYTGALPEMLFAFLTAQGVSTKLELYKANGFTSGHINDFALEYWSTP